MTDREPNESRERNLWQEVLFRAVLDAKLEPAEGVVTGREALMVREARAYLTKRSKDLEIVCSLAGIDVDAMIERVRKMLPDAPQIEMRKSDLADKPLRKKNAIFEHDGKRLTVTEWSKVTGIAAANISHRLRAGWRLEDALCKSTLRSRHSGHAKLT